MIFGLTSQGNKKAAVEELMQDIELATKKSKAKIKEEKDKWDFVKIMAADEIDSYKPLIKRSPFFRVRDEEKVKKAEPVQIKEPPKKAVLKYKGRVMMGSKVTVVIEDQGTGKSFFVQEGDVVGDFLVSKIDEKRVVMKKKGGEELILNAVRKDSDADIGVDKNKPGPEVK